MKTLIVDDERLARQELKSLLAAFDEIEIIGECSNADEAKSSIESLKPDLVFLDIQMPGKTGFELLKDIENMPNVIFVTAFDEYAIRAFEVNALDYLLKPVEPLRLEEAIKKVTNQENDLNAEEITEPAINQHILKQDDQIFLKSGEKCWLVELKDVRMFESEGNYVKVFFDKNKPLVLRSLNTLENRLDPKLFFRANRKFIINLRWIEKVVPWFNGGLQVTLKTGEEIEISRRQTTKFKDLLSL